MAILRNEHGQEYGDTFRYFMDGVEVSEAEAIAAEKAGTHKVARGGSGVVPEELRSEGETREDWLNPWMELLAVV